MLDRFKIGHYTDKSNGTGCTVIFPPEETIVSASVRGASPGTRELALLSPERKLNHINALMLTGGSAFGLSAAQGVVEFLEKKNLGYQTKYGVVPIVPAAVIFDLNIGNPSVRPTAENAWEASKQARYNNDESGCVGAGTGATVGKWNGIACAMKAGIGMASISHGDLEVTALTVVNSVGDIIDRKGNILAGAIDDSHRFIANDDSKKHWGNPAVGMAENTVLAVIMTNAIMNKQQVYYLAERAHYGIARRIEPSHTSYDGDITFVLAFPGVKIAIDSVSAIAVHAVEESIIDAVKKAEKMSGILSVNDLE
jgi:L-aminopeptidase/D-esterase-like protein